MSSSKTAAPAGNLAGLRTYFRADVVSGFLVFLIALPLCLAIAQASGFPPVAGLLTAIIGGIGLPLIGGSELTIKGPAAGLIVIALGAVEELGQGDALLGYRLALATIVVAGIFQILFGLLRSGVLSDFFPAAAVQGMMAAIGLIIMVRQAYGLAGVAPVGTQTWHLLVGLPHALATANPDVLLIGGISLLILFGLPFVKPLGRVPAPLFVLLVAIPLGRYFDLGHAHAYLFRDHHPYPLGPQLLVKLPASLRSALTLPDFSQVFSGTSLKYIIMFAVVGALESLLNTKAIDRIDPNKRKADLNRDLLAVGVGTTLAGLVGGLPMIAEIGRSSANVANGARTRWANFFHGVCMLLFVTVGGGLLAQIPLAALAAMLVFTGYRLAAPRELRHLWQAGGEQLTTFLVTLVVTLSTDPLVGLGAGLGARYLSHLFRGLPLRNTFQARVLVEAHEDGSYYHVAVHDAAVFSNYLSLQRALDELPKGQHVVINLAPARLVDHTVLENLLRFRADYNATGGVAELTGLDRHQAAAGYPTPAPVLTWPHVG